MRVAIFGVGGEGGFFGSRMIQAGNDVTLIARGATLNTLKSTGLIVDSNMFGSFNMNVKATDNPSEVESVDLVIFCVKTYDLEAAAQQMIPLIGAETVVIPVQNGIDAAERIGEIIGIEHLFGGVSWVNAIAKKPGIISHGGSARLIFGELDGKSTNRSAEMQKRLVDAGIVAELHLHIKTAIWEKLVANSAINGVFSLTRLPAGPVMDCLESWQLLRDTMEENTIVARACGIPLPLDFVEKTLKPLGQYARWARPSMQVDLMAGRRLELEAMIGAIVRLGANKGIRTPINTTIYGALKPHVNGIPTIPTPP